jgi:hypothetical protein
MSKIKTSVSRSFSVGQKFNIEIATLRRSYITDLVGFKSKDYLICPLPDVKKYGYLKDELQTGVGIVIRTICEATTGEVVAFKSEVLAKILHPYPLIFYKYPKEIKTQPLRKQLRLHTHINGILSCDTKEGKELLIEGIITNRSDHGCAFEYASEVKTIIENETVTISYSLLESDSKSKQYTVAIRSQRFYDQVMTVGLEYVDEKNNPDDNSTST